jgi:hypothetical protein
MAAWRATMAGWWTAASTFALMFALRGCVGRERGHEQQKHCRDTKTSLHHDGSPTTKAPQGKRLPALIVRPRFVPGIAFAGELCMLRRPPRRRDAMAQATLRSRNKRYE